jgi:ribosome-binding factor A
MTRRQEQLASVLREAVQEVLSRGLNDPRVSGLITVTGLDLSPDLEYATIRVSVLPAERQQLTFHGIKAAGAYIRREVGDKVKNRKLPKFNFELDSSFKKQLGVIEALEHAKHGQKPAGWGSAPAKGPDSPGEAGSP